MIKEHTIKNISNILHVINDAAVKYKGVIPDECLHEPYMSKQELTTEFDNGVRMFGYSNKNKLIGVMGFQEFQEVILIRHAYILSHYQRSGVGKLLLNYLFTLNKNTCFLVGTWRKATWAIHFYEKFGFVVHTKKETTRLLKRYWDIPLNQIENSVVLEK